MSLFLEELNKETNTEVFVVAFRNAVNIYNAKGSMLKSYNKCDVKEQTFCIVDEYYMVAAANAQPNVRIWPFAPSVHVSSLDFTVPCKPTVLTVSKCSKFCALAADKTLYLFELNGQFMFSKVPCHTNITCLKFNSESKHIIVGTQSGIVKFYSLFSSRPCDPNQEVADKPDFAYFHSNAVVGIFVQIVAVEHQIISFDKVGEIKIINNFSVIANLTSHFLLTSLITDCFQQTIYFGTEFHQIGKLPVHEATSFDPNSMKTNGNIVENAHSSAVLGLCLCPSSNDFASCGDKRIIIWNPTPLTPKMTIEIAEFPLGFYWIEEPKPLIGSKELRPHFQVGKFEKIDLKEKTLKFMPDKICLAPEDYSFFNFFQVAE